MKVIFSSPQKLLGKSYKKGSANVSDRLVYTAQFKAMVKAGKVAVVSKDVAAQKIQAGKDSATLKKALAARKVTLANLKAKTAEGAESAHALAKAAFAKAKARAESA